MYITRNNSGLTTAFSFLLLLLRMERHLANSQTRTFPLFFLLSLTNVHICRMRRIWFRFSRSWSDLFLTGSSLSWLKGGKRDERDLRSSSNDKEVWLFTYTLAQKSRDNSSPYNILRWNDVPRTSRIFCLQKLQGFLSFK